MGVKIILKFSLTLILDIILINPAHNPITQTSLTSISIKSFRQRDWDEDSLLLLQVRLDQLGLRFLGDLQTLVDPKKMTCRQQILQLWFTWKKVWSCLTGIDHQPVLLVVLLVQTVRSLLSGQVVPSHLTYPVALEDRISQEDLGPPENRQFSSTRSSIGNKAVRIWTRGESPLDPEDPLVLEVRPLPHLSLPVSWGRHFRFVKEDQWE